jgi:hypothetical protein
MFSGYGQFFPRYRQAPETTVASAAMESNIRTYDKIKKDFISW